MFVCVCVKTAIASGSLRDAKFSQLQLAGGRSVVVSLLPTKTLTTDGDTRLGQSGVPADLHCFTNIVFYQLVHSDWLQKS